MKIYLSSIETKHSLNFAFVQPFGRFIEMVPIEEAEMIFLVLTNYWDWEIDMVEYQKILDSKQPIVIFDYWEIGWDKDASGVPFLELNSFFHRTKAYFKRELKKNDNHGWFPIDFYNDWTWPTTDTFEQFCSRPIDILMIWGLSNPIRPEVHGSLMAGCHKYGWTYIGNRSHIAYESGQKAVLLHQPHYDRIPEREMYELQSKAKITISLPGAGVKCFRSSEAPLNSVMAMIEDLYYPQPIWQAGWDKTNCVFFSDIVVERGGPMDYGCDLKYVLNNSESLYQKYLNGTKRAHEIKPENVWKEHILPKIL